MRSVNGRRPRPKIAGRLSRCRRQLRTAGADALLITNDVDYFYVTGFTANESAVIVTDKDVHVITDARFEQEVAREVPWAQAWMRRGMLNDEIANACKALKIKKLAVQPRHFSVGDQADLKKRLNGTRFVIAPPVFEKMRRLKDPTELAAMKRAIQVAEDAFKAARKSIQVGQTELEMAARLEYEMKRRGASGPAFPTICAEGGNSAAPHAVPGKRRVRKGSAVLFDWGARVGGYCSDLTRMVFVDSIPPKFAEVYKVVLDAQLAAIDAIAPGRRMKDVDAVARKIVANSGLGERFTHGLGHGLGLDVHEAPSLSWRSDERLAPGMVVTVEPGVYLPGIGGVRIEDDVLVTRRSGRVLTKFPKSLRSCIVQATPQ